MSWANEQVPHLNASVHRLDAQHEEQIGKLQSLEDHIERIDDINEIARERLDAQEVRIEEQIGKLQSLEYHIDDINEIARERLDAQEVRIEEQIGKILDAPPTENLAEHARMLEAAIKNLERRLLSAEDTLSKGGF